MNESESRYKSTKIPHPRKNMKEMRNLVGNNANIGIRLGWKTPFLLPLRRRIEVRVTSIQLWNGKQRTNHKQSPKDRDGPWPDTSLLLTCSKYEANPPLTRVLSDPIWRDFFDPKEEKIKNLTFWREIFQIQSQTINGRPDSTRATKNLPDQGQKILTRTHHYQKVTSTVTCWSAHGYNQTACVTLNPKLE